MLTHPTQEKLRTLKLNGMAKALEEQLNMTDIDDLSFEERLGLLVDRETTERENKRLTARLKKARLLPADKLRRGHRLQESKGAG